MPKISGLPTAIGADVTTDDLIPFVDMAGPTTKKVTLDIFRIALLAGAGMTGTPLGGVSTLQTSGNVGIGTAPVADKGLFVTGSMATATSQYGMYNTASFSSAATVAGYGLYVSTTTAAAAYTQTNQYGIYIANPTKGAGSAITNRYGMYLEGTSGAATINYTLFVAIGDRGIDVDGAAVGSSTTKFGIVSNPTFNSSTTSTGYGIYTAASTAAAAFTLTSAVGLYVDSSTIGAASAITNLYGIYVNTQSGAATNNIGIFVRSGLLVNDGNVSIGTGVPGANVGLGMTVTLSGNATQLGLDIGPTMNSSATTAVGIRTGVTTAAAAFTVTNAYGIYINTLSKGAASAVTNNYGIYVNTVSGGATINIGIYVAGGGVQVAAGNLGIGAAPTADTGVLVANTLTTATSQYALDVTLNTTFSTAATVAGYGLYLAPTTVASGFTMTNFYGAYIAATAKGAGSTITNRYGLYVVGPTDGGTINAAIWVANGDVILAGSGSALATNATSGFPMIPTCAGTPSGTPTQGGTGRAAIILDTTGVKLWVYSPTAAAWKGVVVA